MGKTLQVNVHVKSISLSRRSVGALKHLSRYDIIAFTSKNARKFFYNELKKRNIQPPSTRRILHVGPRNDLLKHDIDDKRILFPRSDIAPPDIVSHLRKKGASVQTIPLYTTTASLLSHTALSKLSRGEYDNVYFRSSSGVRGFLGQLRGQTREKARILTALCMGRATASAARKSGFKSVKIVGIL